MPGLHILRNYRMDWLRNDLVAGLVLTAVLVPVGMGYAEAAGLPGDQWPVCYDRATVGLRNLWTQPHHGSGPDSSLAAVIAAVVVPLAARDSPGRSHWQVCWQSLAV